MTVDEYRRLALSFPEATESAHMGHPDVRVRGKIFATLRPKEKYGVLKLAREQQEMLVAAEPKMFEAVSGGWGRKGWTRISLAAADSKTARSALQMAWRNTAPKSVRY
ncbi:MAG: MmcQ/YjbR family DNA-binding protein [Alphaproteobacteria bacterium]